MAQAEVFCMLVERLGNVEDSIARIERLVNRCDSKSPKLTDLKPDHIAVARKQTDDGYIMQKILDSTVNYAVCSRRPSHATAIAMQQNGFRMYEDATTPPGQYQAVLVFWGPNVEETTWSHLRLLEAHSFPE